MKEVDPVRIFIKRIVGKYEQLIEELNAIHEENKELVDEANKDPDKPEVREWARLARENLRRIQMAEAERDFLKEKYNV